jgi:hypothetical protein
VNDDNKVLNQNPPPSQSDQVQPQAQPQIQPQAVVPVGSPNKETGPVVSLGNEFIKPSEAGPQVDGTLKELGVEAKKDEPNLSDEHKGIMEHAKEFTPVSASPSGNVVMPMSEEEIANKLKTGQDDDSGKWLAGLIKKIIAWSFKAR